MRGGVAWDSNIVFRIVFRTDPKNQDYVVERGAKRNTEPWRRGLEGELDESDEARLDRIEREMAEADGDGPAAQERNAMAELEAKTADAKREMAVADALDEIRSRNARIEKAHRDGVDVADLVLAAAAGLTPEEAERRRQDEEDAEAARRAFAFARAEEMLEEPIEGEMDETEEAGSSAGASSSTAAPSSSSIAASTSASANTRAAAPVLPPADTLPAPSFKRQVKKKKDHATLLGIKKKQPLV